MLFHRLKPHSRTVIARQQQKFPMRKRCAAPALLPPPSANPPAAANPLSPDISKPRANTCAPSSPPHSPPAPLHRKRKMPQSCAPATAKMRGAPGSAGSSRHAEFSTARSSASTRFDAACSPGCSAPPATISVSPHQRPARTRQAIPQRRQHLRRQRPILHSQPKHPHDAPPHRCSPAHTTPPPWPTLNIPERPRKAARLPPHPIRCIQPPHPITPHLLAPLPRHPIRKIRPTRHQQYPTAHPRKRPRNPERIRQRWKLSP